MVPHPRLGAGPRSRNRIRLGGRTAAHPRLKSEHHPWDNPWFTSKSIAEIARRLRIFYSSLFAWKIAQQDPAAMMETGKGITGHVTTLGHEPYHYTIFLRGNGRGAGISRQSSFTGRKNSRASGASSQRHVFVDAGSRSKHGRPLETRCQLNVRTVAILECGSLLPPLQRRACLACSFPILRRRQSRIRNRAAQAARSKMPAAPMPPPTHMVTKP